MITIILDVLENVSMRKSQKNFVVNLLETILSMVGRVNFRNMSRYSPICEKTISRNFARIISFFQINLLIIQRILPLQGGRLAIAFDPFFIEKSGNKTYGRDTFWNGSNSKADKGLEGCGFAVIDVDSNEGYPLYAMQTPNRDELEKATGIPGANRVDYYIQCIKSCLSEIRQSYPLICHLVADAYFAKKKVVDALLGLDFHIISKLRSDANLRFLDFEKKEGRGRPKKYGKKVNTKDLGSFKLVCELSPQISLYENTFYNVTLKRNVKVVCIARTGKKEERATALLFSTDLSLSAQEIYQYYRARFQIEFIYRDAKQYTGLTHCQARSKEKIHNHLNASLTALLVVKVHERELRQQTGTGKLPFSMATHKRKNHNEMVLNRIISIFGLDLSFIKSHPNYPDLLNYGAIRSGEGARSQA